MSTFFTLIVYFISPFYLEYILEMTSNKGNMELYGLYLGLYYKRNLLYLSSFLLFISYLFSYKYLLFSSCIFFTYSLYAFIGYVSEWRDIFVIYC